MVDDNLVVEAELADKGLALKSDMVLEGFVLEARLIDKSMLLE